MHIPAIRTESPRLYHPVGDLDFAYPVPRDAERRRILQNLVADCGAWASRRPWRRIPQRPHSPHPFHQLYLTFYTGMQAAALIELYAFAWRFTGEARWLRRARTWLLAASRWEHGDAVEEHFYTANRYMHAFAVALDLLGDELAPGERAEVTDCLVGLMERWWPEVDAQRHSAAAGHHAVVDNGHFGVAALHLLGRHPQAEEWVATVIDRFYAAILPAGCGPRGEPVDGGSFWTWENLWLLHFCDALRNVTGIDLCGEFPRRLTRPLEWFRHHLVSPDRCLGAGSRDLWAPTLLRLAQEAGDAKLRAAALADPGLGRMYNYHAGVKGSSAECVIAHGAYALLYCDPHFRPHRRRLIHTLSRTFTEGTHRGAILRSSWGSDSLVVHVSGYDGRVASGYGDLQVVWRGEPTLQSIACHESRPVACGAVPSVGGQSQWLLMTGPLGSLQEGERLRARAGRVDVEYLLLKADPPVLVVAARRRPRGVRPVREGRFVRLDGRDHLQYPRQPHFDPAAGCLHLRVRLRQDVDADRPQVLWGVGVGVPGLLGPQVNGFALGFFGGPGLVFAVQSQRYTRVDVRIPPETAAVTPGQWHDVAVSWGGLNDPRGRPFIALSLDGVERRCVDAAAFGELDRDSQNLASRSSPRVFYVHPNTELAFGAAMQAPQTGVACDLARIDLRCPGRQPLLVDPAGAGGAPGAALGRVWPDSGSPASPDRVWPGSGSPASLGRTQPGSGSPVGPGRPSPAAGAALVEPAALGCETGSGELAWLLHPVDLRRLTRRTARLGAGRGAVDVRLAYPHTCALRREEVPHAPSGLAAGSLRTLGEPPPDAYTRLVASAGQQDELVLVFAPASAHLRVSRDHGGFTLTTAAGRWRYDAGGRRGPVLMHRP